MVFPDDEAEMKVGVKLSLLGPGRQLSPGPGFEHHHWQSSSSSSPV